ncbi:MAG TPA: sigma-70 family RNA polymerase sigma factor, partial [Stellaceae bacterium]|nr:sigma-70 family RNA polymerase sigma factor [Stellaceae bacterium]
AWLFTILHNQYVNYVRRSVREGAAVGLTDSEQLLTCAPQQGHRLALRDLERAIAKLPEEQRSAILLVGLEGMRYEEVATVLDVPVGTIRSRLSRGREALRKLVGLDPSEDGMSEGAAPSCVERRRAMTNGVEIEPAPREAARRKPLRSDATPARAMRAPSQNELRRA